MTWRSLLRSLLAAVLGFALVAASLGAYYVLVPIPPMFLDARTEIDPNPARVGAPLWLTSSYYVTRDRWAEVSADIYNAFGQRVATTIETSRRYERGPVEDSRLPLTFPYGLALQPGIYRVVVRVHIPGWQVLLERETTEAPVSATFTVVAR